MKVIVPMAGEGSRTSRYPNPKPFVDIDGKPMVIRAIEPFLDMPDTSFVFICRKEHEPYSSVLPGDKIFISKTTEGTACTVLLAEEHVRNEEKILVLNSDQIMKFNAMNFVTIRENLYPFGLMFTFRCLDKNPKWSYVSVNRQNQITAVAEKEAISDIATCGAYYWSSFGLYKHFANRMISANRRVKGEFYSSMVYTEPIKDKSYMILPFMVEEMIGLGDSDSIDSYLRIKGK